MTRNFLAVIILSTAFLSCSAQKEKDSQAADTPINQMKVSPPKLTDVGEFEKLLAQSGIQIVDVRTPEEHAEGYIAGAQLMDISDEAGFKNSVQGLDKSKPVLVYCAAGGRSARASEYLSEQGFTAVYDLKGGMSAWKGAGKTIQK